MVIFKGEIYIMIEVAHSSEKLVKTVKEPGLKGVYVFLFILKKWLLWSGQGFDFRSTQGADSRLYRANGAGKSTTIKMLTWGFWNRHLVFVGQRQDSQIIAEIMSRILESFSDKRTQLWWIWHRRDHLFWRRFTWCQTRFSISVWTFEWSLIWRNLIRILCDSFYWVNGCGGYCGFLASQSQSSL